MEMGEKKQRRARKNTSRKKMTPKIENKAIYLAKELDEVFNDKIGRKVKAGFLKGKTTCSKIFSTVNKKNIDRVYQATLVEGPMIALNNSYYFVTKKIPEYCKATKRWFKSEYNSDRRFRESAITGAVLICAFTIGLTTIKIANFVSNKKENGKTSYTVNKSYPPKQMTLWMGDKEGASLIPTIEPTTTQTGAKLQDKTKVKAKEELEIEKLEIEKLNSQKIENLSEELKRTTNDLNKVKEKMDITERIVSDLNELKKIQKLNKKMKKYEKRWKEKVQQIIETKKEIKETGDEYYKQLLPILRKQRDEYHRKIKELREKLNKELNEVKQ